jgi:hypothetical protein
MPRRGRHLPHRRLCDLAVRPSSQLRALAPEGAKSRSRGPRIRRGAHVHQAQRRSGVRHGARPQQLPGDERAGGASASWEARPLEKRGAYSRRAAATQPSLLQARVCVLHRVARTLARRGPRSAAGVAPAPVRSRGRRRRTAGGAARAPRARGPSAPSAAGPPAEPPAPWCESAEPTESAGQWRERALGARDVRGLSRPAPQAISEETNSSPHGFVSAAYLSIIGAGRVVAGRSHEYHSGACQCLGASALRQ